MLAFKNEYIKIPVGLIFDVLKNKDQSPFALYLVLKSHSSGRLVLNGNDMLLLADILRYKSIKAVKNNLKILLDKDWLGYNPDTRIWFIRSFSHLHNQLKWSFYYVSVFNEDDVKHIDSFLYGSAIGYLAYRQKFKRSSSECKKCRSVQTNSKGFHEVSVNYIAKAFDISVSTASVWKNKAINDGYIERENQYTPINIDRDTYRFLYQNDKLFRNMERYTLPTGRSMLGFRETDLIRCKNLMLKSGKKSKQVKVLCMIKKNKQSKHRMNRFDNKYYDKNKVWFDGAEEF